MSGAEVLGIALGAIPLIVMTFQGYRRVRGLMLEYSSLDRNLRKVLRDITTAEGLFKEAVDTILSDIIEEERREIMLRDLESEHWLKDGLGVELHSVLGRLFQPVMNSVQGAQETVEEIKMVLLELGQPHEGSPSKNGKSPFEALAAGARRTLDFIKTDSIKSPTDTSVRIQSKRKKLKIIASDTTIVLKALLDEMKQHNNSLLAALHCRAFRKSTPRVPYIYSTLPQVLPSARTVENSISGLGKVSLNPKAMQIASKRLYGIVSKTLPCQCHALHLCLDKPVEEKSKQPPAIEPTVNFSFLLTAKYDSKQDTRSPMIPLVFTSSSLGSTKIVVEDCGSKGICEELLASNEEYERYFQDSGGDGNSGFLLRRAPTRMMPVINSDLISLDDLVSSESERLTQYDRLQIAANLVYSILPFYSSPWIRNWTLQSIQFFEKHGLATDTNLTPWTPHVSLKLLPGDRQDQLQFGIKNREIRSLGLILLELGREKRLTLSHDDDDDEGTVLRMAIRDLFVRMGRDYTEIVRKCLYVWSEGDMDLMTEENLNGFLSDLSLLENRAQYYTPSTWFETRADGSLGKCAVK